MLKSDAERLQKIVSIWSEVERQIQEKEITRDRLLEDSFLQWALTTPLYNMGEQVYKLSPEFRKNHPDIPWAKISGLRHRLVHDYEGINWNIIADVIYNEMGPAIEDMKKIHEE